MTWPIPYAAHRIRLHVEGRINAEDAQRQARTAEEILRRLAEQPGIVLADQVGMGKTYVALAVAASVAWAEERARPVVVMVPPALPEKWLREAKTFVSHCILPDASGRKPALRCEVARTGLELFRLLDDPPRERARVIFLSHGAMHHGLADPWVELAVLRLAMRAKRLAKHRKVFHRFAGKLIRTHSQIRDPAVYRSLLRSPVQEWRTILESHDPSVTDDPVPLRVFRAVRRAGSSLGDLVQALESLPLRRSESVGERIRDVRRALREPLRRVWFESLANARFSSPLLVLDEAHHVKNPGTRLASLLVEPDAEQDAALLDGALAGRFERMLFMTATPFQLGHYELLNVLGRFQGARWPADVRVQRREEFGRRMEGLRAALDEAHLATTELDTRWARLDARALGIDVADPARVDAWWRAALQQPTDLPPMVAEVTRLFRRAEAAVRAAEEALRPWILRSVRPPTLPGKAVARRRRHVGAATHPVSGASPTGIAVTDDAVLPFLLAARLQTALVRAARRAGENASRTQTFAEGLASSFDAFLGTRFGGAAQEAEALDDVELSGASTDAGNVAVWYASHLRRALPDRTAFGAHPKVATTVARVLDLWKQGEKVLVFCHWRATGRALERHVSAAIEQWIVEHAAARLRCAPEQVWPRLGAIRRRFEPGEAMAAVVGVEVRRIAAQFPALIDAEDRIADAVCQFARLPSFLTRFFPLEAADERNAMVRAFAAQDASGVGFQAKIERFCRFLNERPELLEDYLAALEGVRKRERADEAAEAGRLLPNVQVVNGGTPQDRRRETGLSFNSPFLPEVLIASSVMAEGIDLHLDCRHVLHHDLDWNPSTLEQRTGRIDRIGAKSERVGQSVNVFMPYIAATHDEKMFLVVTDRERWFQVVMGERHRDDDGGTEVDRLVPLPAAAAAALQLHLGVEPRVTD